MMWLRKALRDDKPQVSPIEDNPVGWSSIYPPDRMGMPDPNVSPVVDRSTMTPQAAWGSLLSGAKDRPVTAAELPAMEQKAQTYVDYGQAVAGATNPIRAFHGSPHTFDRFDLSRIGTGEGAQSYGHGLYFAGNEGVARSYRDALANFHTGPEAAKAYLDAAGGDVAQAIAKMRDHAVNGGVGASADEMRAIRQGLDLLQKGGDFSTLKSPGSMYEVNLRTSPERLLDWDKPLSAQPAPVREAMTDIPGVGKVRGDSGDAAFGSLSNILRLQGKGDPAEASRLLRERGLDGIQYLDQGSRAAGEGSRNYVMFRDDIVDILRRYGLFGLSTAMGGAAATAGAQAPEQ